MSRSNTPSGHTGQPPQGQQQQWRMPPELEVPPTRGAPGQLPAAGQYVPYPPNSPAQTTAGYSAQHGQTQPGYAYPPQGQPQAYNQPDGYAYANPQTGLAGHQFAPPPAASYAQPERYAAAPPMPDLRGSQYDQWPSPSTLAPPAANPQSYDLGNYNPALPTAAYQQPASQGYSQPAGQATSGMPDFNQPQSAQAAYASAAYGNYAPPQSEYQPQPQWSPQDAAYQGQHAAGYAGQPQAAGYATQQPGQPLAAGQAATEFDDDEYEDEEEPRRRGRGLMVIAALVGAIGLGGGLAYGYKTYLKPPTSGNIPVARADKQPAKIKPATPDGKQIAGSGSALQNDGDGGPIRPVQAAASANADAEANGSRKVQTMQIGRDGSIAAPAQQQTQATTVPGMQMVFPSTPNQQRAMPVPTLPDAQPVPVQPRAATPAPRVAAAAVPAPLNAAPDAAPPAVQKKVVAQAPVPKKAAVRDDMAANGGSALGAGEVAAAPAPRKTTGAGFLPVLSIHKTEIDAMRAFADLQQKNPALQGKQPITQVISEGKYAGSFRLMMGTPGSMAAAKEMCVQSGIKDCYPMPY
jgi:hypothetical protein